MTIFSRRTWLIAFAAASTLAACSPGPATTDAEENAAPVEASTIYLVRHAEKLGGDDPSLSEAGKARAIVLASVFQDAGLNSIHSTDYKRTQETATPTARVTGLVITDYDATNLSAFAKKLKAMPGNHLVVGHSNTTPELVMDLGGDPVSPIEEATEYNRLYILTYNEDGSVETLLERYGPPNPE